MDRLFTLTSYSSELSQEYFPPIELDEDGTYVLGLYHLNTYNSIPNIISGKNDYFTFFITDRAENGELDYIPCGDTVAEGSYEIEALEKVLYDLAYKAHEFYLQDRFQKADFKFSLKANVNTQKVEIIASFPIDFKNHPRRIGDVLGFKDMIIHEHKLEVSNSLVKISSVDVINVECNITSGSYINGQSSHTLFSFSPYDVSPGYKISLHPTNILFLPVTSKRLSNINLRLVDQNNSLVNFRGEQIIIQLILRKIR